MKQLNIIVIVLVMFSLGCANFGRKWKNLVQGKPMNQKAVKAAPQAKTFSQSPNNMPGVHRQYKRMTRKKLEEGSSLRDNTGSLWVVEGQGAYLFSQNIMRQIGDPIPVRVEGDAKDQLASKAKIITGLLAKLEARRTAALRGPASSNKKTKAEPAKKPATPTANKNEKDDSGIVKKIPARIVERMVDGNYRVKGSQSMMIGPREYKVIVTGIVRSEDFSEDGITSNQLLDPKFDIVSPKRRSF